MRRERERDKRKINEIEKRERIGRRSLIDKKSIRLCPPPPQMRVLFVVWS